MPRKLDSVLVLVLVAASVLAGCAMPSVDVEARGAAARSPAGRAAAATPASRKVIELESRPATGDELECRNEIVTGTHRRREVCLTRDQRRARREAAQEWLRSHGRAGGVSMIPAPRTR